VPLHYQTLSCRRPRLLLVSLPLLLLHAACQANRLPYLGLLAWPSIQHHWYSC
jgi:hypothetical protein